MIYVYSLEKADIWVYQHFGLNLTFYHDISFDDDESITSMSPILRPLPKSAQLSLLMVSDYTLNSGH